MADIKDYKDYIYQHVFNQSETSDLTIKAFHKEYRLHKVFLLRSPFFEKLFQWKQLADEHESDMTKEGSIDDEDNTTAVSTSTGTDNYDFKPIIIKNEFSLQFDDPYITALSFELVLRRLYHIENENEEQKNIYNCLATANYLGLYSMVEQLIGQSARVSNIYKALECLKFLDSRIIGCNSLSNLHEISKFWLLKDGWEIGVEKWDDVTFSIVTEILKSDLFFVPSEYDRSIFIMKLIERKMDQNLTEDANTLKGILNYDILFPSMDTKSIWELRHYQDKNQESYVTKEVALQAVWNKMALSHSIDMINQDSGRLEYYNFDEDPAYAYVDHSLSESLPSLSYFNEFLETKRNTFSNLATSKICPVRMSFAFPNLEDLASSPQSIKAKDFNYGGITWRFSLDHFVAGKMVFRLCSRSSFKVFSDTKEIPFIYEKNINYTIAPKSYYRSNDSDKSSKIVYKSVPNNKFKMAGSEQVSLASNATVERNKNPNAYLKLFIFGANQRLMLHIVEPTVYSDGVKARFSIDEKDLKIDGKFIEPLKVCLLLGLA